jgi:hypothetical protein
LNESPPQTVNRALSPVPPGWFRFLAPSATDLIFVLLLAGLSCGRLATRLLSDAGIGWHIRNGEYMLATHAITRTDPFSSTMSGQPWYTWEWLYDLAIARIHDAWGLNGVTFVTALLIALTFAAVFRIALRRGTSLPVGVILIILATFSSAIHFFARPHVLSWLLTVLWFCILDSRTYARRLFWLPVLTLLWANLHGGFLVGFVLLGIYFADSLIEVFVSHDPAGRQAAGKRCKTPATVGLLCMLASFVNPYGYKLHVHIYQYLSSRFLMNHIEEFLSPDFHGAAQKCFAVLLLIVILSLAAARRNKLRAAHLLVLLFAAYSGLYAARNIPVSSILFVLITGPLLSQATAEAGSNGELPTRVSRFFSRLHAYAARMGRMEAGLRIHLWPLAAMILGVWICAHDGKLGSRQLMQSHFDENRFPVQAVDEIIRQGLREPIFAVDYWGGYLIYRLYAQANVVLDDRHDLYGAEFLKDYLRVVQIRPSWNKVLDQRRIDWILVPTGSPLANILKDTAQWKIRYEDAVGVVFQRTNPIASQTPGK